MKKYISYARINLKYRIDRGGSFGYRGSNTYGWKKQQNEWKRQRATENKKQYPLGAIYSKNVLPIIEEMIEKKYYKLSYLIEKSNFVKINIEKTDIPLKVLSNINTLQEYDLFINNESLFQITFNEVYTLKQNYKNYIHNF